MIGGLTWSIFSCGEIPDEDVADVPLAVAFHRTDSLMWAVAKALQEDPQQDRMTLYREFLQAENQFFYFLLGLDQVPQARTLSTVQVDSLLSYELTNFLADSNMYFLLDSVRKVFPYEDDFMQSLAPPLKRLSINFSDIQYPDFRTHVTGYQPDADWGGADQILPMPEFFSFGLHYFMGKDWGFYPVNIPEYQKRRTEKDYLPVMMMREVAEGMIARIPASQQPKLVDKMVRAGIKQYFLHQMLPYTPDSLLLMYSSKQMDWAWYYEDRIYKELIPHLFDIDFKLQRDYLTDKPYTTQLSMESAPRIGEFCGWQIVQTYMQRNPDISLEQLCEMDDYEMIFRESRYKP